jgi:AmiR/NasT family two-component response regulator
MNDRTSEERAYDAGKVAADIQARLDEHGRHLTTINGSIDHTGRELAKLHKDLDDLKADLNTREQVSRALAKVVKDAAARQVTTRTFVLGVVMVVIALGGLYLGTQ